MKAPLDRKVYRRTLVYVGLALFVLYGAMLYWSAYYPALWYSAMGAAGSYAVVDFCMGFILRRGRNEERFKVLGWFEVNIGAAYETFFIGVVSVSAFVGVGLLVLKRLVDQGLSLVSYSWFLSPLMLAVLLVIFRRSLVDVEPPPEAPPILEGL